MSALSNSITLAQLMTLLEACAAFGVLGYISLLLTGQTTTSKQQQREANFKGMGENPSLRLRLIRQTAARIFGEVGDSIVFPKQSLRHQKLYR